ncbi:hypothetical protein GCM10009678_30960 [Actinomadura kijaniata]|uniref:Uncharacterized protein n=1 Tax=Actinomadura namibiensis TaxID=182080 RepID=A0A7W3LPN3_ACTNM|nr:hypothetical protein [Actinomadura namibiensis]MBA8951937.1 hypothetical protein [Actinomadura namibiensis]
MPDVPDHVPADRHDALLDRITAEIRAQAPEGWRRVSLVALRVGDLSRNAFTLLMADRSGRSHPWRVERVDEALAELRGLWHRPGRGTWLTARLIFDGPRGATAFHPSPDREPSWSTPPSAEDLARELELFPRDDAHVPGWMRARLGLPPAAAPAAAPAPDRLAATDAIADVLAWALPPDWREAAVEYRAVGDHEEIDGRVHTIFEQTGPFTPPPEVAALFARLRAAGNGSWHVARLGLAHPGGAILTVDRSHPPRWRNAPDPAEFRRETERFPGQQARPAWLTGGRAEPGPTSQIAWRPGPGTAPYTTAEARLMERVRRALIASVPDDVQHVQVVGNGIGTRVVASVMAYSWSLGTRFPGPPQEAVAALVELRREMLRDNAGWYSFQIDMQPDHGVRFGLYGEPSQGWEEDPPPEEACREDLVMYGDPAGAPAWLRERVAAQDAL